MACTNCAPQPPGRDECYTDGIATWFCCGSAYSPYCSSAGSGACGTCDSHSLQCAWPNLSGGFSPASYATSCRPDLPQYSCGTQLYVYDYCNNLSQVCVTIADHGPFTDNFCGQSSPCRSDIGCADRIIDLTPAAFATINSLSNGRTLVQVRDKAPGCCSNC